jgi:hypothetical protein
MSTIATTCPHCARVERLSIQPLGRPSNVGQRRSWLKPVQAPRFTPLDAVCLLICQFCGGHSIGVFGVTPGSFKAITDNQGAAAGVEALQFEVELLTTFPGPDVADVPVSVPPKAAALFIEASDGLKSGRGPAGLIGHCRSVLDVCLRERGADGKTRRAQIGNLRDRGLLTESLAAWAEQLWSDGNEAIHEIEGSAELAQQHVAFLKLFFEVAYRLPEQVAASQAPEENQ